MGTDTFESNVKKTAEAKNIVAYKEYFEGTSKYFDQINTMQLNQLKNRKKMLAKLGGDVNKGHFKDIYQKFKQQNETNTKKNSKEKKDDNININDNSKQENNDEEIDLAFYSEKRDNFQNLKEAVETLIKESKDKQVTTILKKLLAEITPIIKVKGEILKSFGLNTRHEELLNRYTQLKNISESDDYDKSDLHSLLNKKSNSNNNEKLDHEKSDNDNSEDLDGYDSEDSNDEFEDSYNELYSEEDDESENSDDEYEGLDGEFNFDDEDEDGSEDSNDEFKDSEMVKILRSKEQNDEKDIKLMENNTKTNDTNVNNNNNNKINNEIDESQYEYELRRTDYINEIEAKLMNAAGIINAIIESQELQKKKIEEAKKNEKKVKKIEKTNDKLDDKIPINKDICVFLLKLLRTKETSINTKAIKDIMMINKMVEMADFERYSEKNNDNTYEYEKIMLETMFEDSSIYKSKDKDKNKDDASILARFLFRLYYVVSHNARVGTIKDTNRQGPTELTSDDFCTSYKEICVGVEQGKFVNALEKLSDMVDKETKQNSNKKLYDTIKKYLNELKNPEAKTHIDEAISEINRSCDNKLLKEHINTQSNIFKKDEYFKIDKTIYNSEKYEEKIANKPANDNLKKETSNENKETTANNNTTNPA